MGLHCDLYGKEWEEDDPACDDCSRRNSCKRLTLGKTNNKKPKAISRAPYSYHTNPTYVLPFEGEPALSRILKNAIAAALSAIGGEIFVFFQEWRWPFTPPTPSLPSSTQVEDKEPPKKTLKVAKKIRVNDIDDDYDDDDDFDLDDL